ncbi:MAG: polysaccharide biosynthesis/export family protein [Bacteroidia bacterium]|nr:polysaccharide biosynthesis/export family protein [Bacteroidia bacterium]
MPIAMRYLFILFTTAILLSSCKVFRSNLMLKTPKDFTYDKLVDSLSKNDYKIAVNDILLYKLNTNNGSRLLEDLTKNTGGSIRSELETVVESDGFAKMPLLGRLHVAGLATREAEQLMEQKFSEFYIDPYINLKVNNKRVIVFPGNGAAARVIPIANNNTSVLESIALAGGIVEDGKAYKVKLIRANPDPNQKPLVYLLDLSDIKGISVGQSIVQAGDIIYVEPRYKPLATVSREIAPIITLATSFLILYQFSRLVNK